MYLITVARAAEEGRSGPVPVADIAAVLSVSVASAHEMVRKLVDRRFLTYEPYRGVELSDDGRRVADRVLRTRRLWSTFLVEHLGLSPGDADDQACHLEHITSVDTAERLAAFLGNPGAGPLGRPIPAGGGDSSRPNQSYLIGIATGTRARVVAINAGNGAARFLAAEGIVPGAGVTVAAVGSSGLLLEVDGDLVHVGTRLAEVIEVEVGDRP